MSISRSGARAEHSNWTQLNLLQNSYNCQIFTLFTSFMINFAEYIFMFISEEIILKFKKTRISRVSL